MIDKKIDEYLKGILEDVRVIPITPVCDLDELVSSAIKKISTARKIIHANKRQIPNQG